MSIEKLPGIGELDPESLCYSIYRHLYNTFFNAQDKKDTDHPWGVTEGDDTSIRLHNTAYGFAEAISLGIDENGFVEGETLLEYLKKSGGNMSGRLTANYGFEAGIDNDRILSIFKNNPEELKGVRIDGILEIGATALYMGGKQFLSYVGVDDTVVLESAIIDFKDSVLLSKGELLFGNNKESGVYLSPDNITIKSYPVYHKGNANLSSVDWIMGSADVNGNLKVTGPAQLLGNLNACEGIQLGANSKILMAMSGDYIHVTGFLSFGVGYGIKISDIPVLIRSNDEDIQLGAAGGDLLLGSPDTQKTRLLTHLSTDDGEYTIVTKYGGGYFPDFLKVRHNSGDILFSSYREDKSNEGVIVHKRLKFREKEDVYLYGTNEGIGFSSCFSFMNPETLEKTTINYRTLSQYKESTSRYRQFHKDSASLTVSTEADFFVTDKPFEAKGHIGIDNSYTRLVDGSLFFSESNYLLSTVGGIKYYGNALFLSNVSSEFFSSGLAGSGWAILHNKTTGNTSATFDELTIRKRMRIYEMEVQKISATNGSLWVSDNCSGDTVQKL